MLASITTTRSKRETARNAMRRITEERVVSPRGGRGGERGDAKTDLKAFQKRGTVSMDNPAADTL
jgi:hypothetical protein